MTQTTAEAVSVRPASGSNANLEPFALRDAPSLIEAVFPAQKVSFEAQRERKAGAGQTLTALGSYWKVCIPSTHRLNNQRVSVSRKR